MVTDSNFENKENQRPF